MKPFRSGLVLGKFLPLHAGHGELVRAALSQCDQVTIVLGARTDEPIPMALRRQWLEEVHPQARVCAYVDDTPVDFDDPVAWTAHVGQIRRALPEPVDAVFSSEPYGDELALRLGAEHVSVDQPRLRVPMSATAVRADPAASWWALPAPVRAWFVRRIVIVGAESTGTTTLARALADDLGCAWVPEFGREWSEVRPGGLEAPWHTDEFDHIAAEQSAREDAAARAATVPWLVADTDALATGIWHERYVGTRAPAVEALAAGRPPALYVLTLDDIPFEQDSMRDGEHLRPWMTDRFREVLAAQPAPVLEVGGALPERLAAVRTALATLTWPSGGRV